MALSTELYGLKSAGTYRFEKDQSVIQNTVEPLNNVRLLVGFSKTGPFNTPVYITTTKEFTDTFGEIDRNLEKKGAYFHRSCLAALSAGPIYALNLLKLDPERDKVSVMQFATSATCEAQTINPASNLFPYQGMYNIDTFYTPSEESFLFTVGRKGEYDDSGTNNILDFTNIGKTPVSVIVTKSSEYNSSAYDVTAQEWYGKGNVPEFMRPTSYISDFFVDVYVIGGDWGGRFDDAQRDPYERYASDIKFGKYFDRTAGLIRRKNPTDTTDTLFAQFLNEPDVQLIGKYTGCLIPGFIDKNGHNMYIEYLINSDTAVNGLMCAVNEQIFDGSVVIDGDANGIDMIGHSVYDKMLGRGAGEAFSDVNFLSYRGSVSQDIAAGLVTDTTSTDPVATYQQGEYTVTDGAIALDVPGVSFITNTLDPDISGSTGTDSSKYGGGIVLKWYSADVDADDKSNTWTLYAYYYNENDDNSYIAPADSYNGKLLEELYSHVKGGNNAYFTYDDGNYSELVPVVKATRTTLRKLRDDSLPASEKSTTDTEAIQAMINSKWSNPDPNPKTFGANPLVKYTFTITTSKEGGLAVPASGAYRYILDSAFSNVAYAKDNTLLFVSGGNVYDKRSSLGTNDYIMTANSGSAETADRYDIDWRSNIGEISEIEGYVITNKKYLPRYVVAVFDNDYNQETSYTSLPFDESDYCFDHTGNILAEPISSTGLYIILGAANFNTTIEVKTEAEGQTAKDNEFFIPVDAEGGEYDNVKVGNYILADDGFNGDDTPRHRLTRIVTINGVADKDGVITHRLVRCQDKVSLTPVDTEWKTTEAYNKFTDAFRNYNVFTLGGFTMRSEQMPDGTDERQHEILDLLSEDSENCNLYNALIDRELIQFRYVVDTFGLGIEPMCKAQYTRLCQGRKSAFAIINMPSVNDFKNSPDPSFIDKNGSVSAEYIAKGANPATNPSFLFSLPDIVNGSTWGAYYYPYLKVYSNYTTINVPPAAYVSNNYIAKYGAGSPWTLVAGQNRGVISGNSVVGVESSLIRDNRDWLEPAGINSIIYQNNIGCVIYANKTAKQTPKSALSSINCREACIYIQDGVEKILRNYLFETNTAQTRLEIKTLVDNFLDMVKNNGGVYDYKTVMDSSNNDAEVIDHNMGVIDIFIEPVRGLEILVQKLTILRTGAIESGTFE